MAIVYRVENANGDGPYQGKWYWDGEDAEKPAFLRDRYDSKRLYRPDPHPAPQEDGIPSPIDYDEVFGFRTLTQLAAWMLREKATDAEKLTRMGYRVGVYECFIEDIREGGRQCVFYHNRAVKVREYTMEEVLALLPIPNELPG